MSADSPMRTPVFGSTRYGAVVAPATSSSSCRRGDPFPVERSRYGRSSSAKHLAHQPAELVAVVRVQHERLRRRRGARLDRHRRAAARPERRDREAADERVRQEDVGGRRQLRRRAAVLGEQVAANVFGLEERHARRVVLEIREGGPLHPGGGGGGLGGGAVARPRRARVDVDDEVEVGDHLADATARKDTLEFVQPE